MNENEFLAKTVVEQLAAGQPLVLVSVMGTQGSAPRHDGAKMVVGVEGRAFGTIGGSLIEAAAVKESRNVFSAGRSKAFLHELTGKDAGAPGMICGGTAEILLDFIAPSEANREFSQLWYDTACQGKNFYILTHLKGDGDMLHVLGHTVLQLDGNVSAGGLLKMEDIEKLKPELHNVSATSILSIGSTRVMVDRVRKMKTLYCFGAGHVAVPTAHMAALAGFRVVVLDDRPEYANAERFPEAHNIVVVADFNRACNGLEVDEDSFIVIVTRGHQYDRAVLEQSLKTNAGYIGMISSQRKRAAIYEALTAQGVSQERLGFVHSPIGIDIGGETPEEIAVSIVAELIKVRNDSHS